MKLSKVLLKKGYKNIRSFQPPNVMRAIALVLYRHVVL